jgi:hypothetical protein
MTPKSDTIHVNMEVVNVGAGWEKFVQDVEGLGYLSEHGEIPRARPHFDSRFVGTVADYKLVVRRRLGQDVLLAPIPVAVIARGDGRIEVACPTATEYDVDWLQGYFDPGGRGRGLGQAPIGTAVTVIGGR